MDKQEQELEAELRSRLERRDTEPWICHGLTKEEWERPADAALSAGLTKLASVRDALNHQVRLRDAERRDRDAGNGRDGETGNRGDGETERGRKGAWASAAEDFWYVPLWRRVSGMIEENDKGARPVERSMGILKLLRAVVKLARWELKRQAEWQKTKKLEPQVPEQWSREETEEEALAMGYRTFQWDPLRAICYQLEIPQALLSRFSKEATGMSAPELMDRLKADGARARMKEELKKFVVEWRQGEQGKSKKEKGKSEADEIWAALKASRRAPRWHRSSWAASLGFSSYTRFFRACLLAFGKTPHEVEFEIIEELMSSTGREESATDASEGKSKKEKGKSDGEKEEGAGKTG